MKLIETIKSLHASFRAATARMNEIAKSIGLHVADLEGELSVNKDGDAVLKATSGKVRVTPELAKEIRSLRTARRLGLMLAEAGAPLGAIDSALRSEELAAELAASKKDAKKASKKASKSKVEAPVRDTGAAVLANA